MPLADVDLSRRRSSVGLPADRVDFTLYSYNKQSFSEQYFTDVHRLLTLFDVSNPEMKDSICHWIEVINNSSESLPHSVKVLCDYFQLHSLTTEDISTLAPMMKLDILSDYGAIFLLMKIITWNETHVEQQQISFYLKCSQNLLITFREKSTRDSSLFREIRQRLRRRQQIDDNPQQHRHNRLRELDVDYLFYCLLDAIIDRYIFVLDDISTCIGQIDQKLMADSRSRTLSTLFSIYRLKHDLLHMRILFNPLTEIIFRLQKTQSDNQLVVPARHIQQMCRLGLTHHILRRQPQMARRVPSPVWSPLRSTTHVISTETTSSSLFLHEYLYVYLNDMSNHIVQVLDTLEMHRESVSSLISFLLALNDNDIQETLKLLMLITVIFMPCTLFTAINSTNFNVQPPLEYKYGYYIVLSLLAFNFIGMIIWYKIKRWI